MKLKIYIIKFIIILIAIQLSSFGGNEIVYNLIRNIISSLVIFTFLLDFKKNTFTFITDKIVKHSVIYLFFFLIIYLIIYGILPIQFNFSVIRDVFLILLIIVISKNTLLDKEKLLTISQFFVFSMTLSALTIPLFISNGFIINDLYLPIPKNQISPIYVVAILTSVFIIHSYNLTTLKKVSFLGSCLLLIIVLLVIRGRTSLIILFLSFIFFYLIIYKKIKYFFFFLFMAIILSPIYVELVYDSLFLNYDINDINSITTGRTDVYLQSIEFIQKNLLFGKLDTDFKTETIVHNYILKLLTDFGLFSFFLLFIYFYLLFFIVYRIFNSNKKLEKFSSWLVLILFMVSMSEYSFPYSPGSSVFFVYFFFGQSVNPNLNF